MERVVIQQERKTRDGQGGKRKMQGMERAVVLNAGALKFRTPQWIPLRNPRLLLELRIFLPHRNREEYWRNMFGV